MQIRLSPFLLSSAIEQEILLNHDHQIAQHDCVVLRPLPDIIMDVLLGLMTRAMPFFRMCVHRSGQGLNTVCHKSSWPTGFDIFVLHVLLAKPSLLYVRRATLKDIQQ